MTNSTVYSNAATVNGGGLAISRDATAAMTNCTISGNTAGYFGGGVAANGDTRIAHSTIVSNTATRQGGGLYNFSGDPITLSHSIVSGNKGPSGKEVYNEEAATVNANAYNLFGHGGEDDVAAFAGSFSPTGTDINATSDGTDPTAFDAILAPLADNGGDTETHALVAGSPAIDAGNLDFTPPPQYDQRGPGYQRIVGDRIDIGAYEFGAGDDTGPSGTQPVGGVTRPSNSLALLRPWIALAALLAVTSGGAVLFPRLHRRS